MNKVLALLNLELKRNMRIYLIYVALASLAMIGINVLYINSYIKSPKLGQVKWVMDTYHGVSFGNTILEGHSIQILIVGLGVVGLLIYSVYMWIREYTESNKTIYTLLTIPQNRFNIYISKLIASVVMIHGYLLSMILSLIVSKVIFNIRFRRLEILESSIGMDLGVYNNLSRYTIKRMIPMDLFDYITTYWFMLIAGLSILFVITILILSYKNSEKIVGVSILILVLSALYLKARFSIRLYIILQASTISILGVDILVDLLTIIIMGVIAYKLLNNKIAI